MVLVVLADSAMGRGLHQDPARTFKEPVARVIVVVFLRGDAA